MICRYQQGRGHSVDVPEKLAERALTTPGWSENCREAEKVEDVPRKHAEERRKVADNNTGPEDSCEKKMKKTMF